MLHSHLVVHQAKRISEVKDTVCYAFYGKSKKTNTAVRKCKSYV